MAINSPSPCAEVQPTPTQPKMNPTPQEINSLAALFNQGRLSEAAKLAQLMTANFPQHWAGWKMLGIVFKQLGRDADALPLLQRAAALSPEDAEIYNNLGITFHDMGRLEEAEASLRRALEINADFVAAHSNLGSVLEDLGRVAEAETSHRRALQISPALAEVHYNLGNLLKKQGRLGAAESSYRQTLQLKPDYAQAYNNLGVVLNELRQPEEAEVTLRRAIELNPNYADAHSNLGIVLQNRGRLDEAEVSCRKALSLNPRLAEAQNNLGGILQEMVRLDEAEASYRRALEIDPDYIKAHSNLLFLLNYKSGIDPADCFAEAKRYGQKAAGKVKAQFAEWSCPMQPERLRIGLVSGDFINHPVGYFLEGVLAKLDLSSVELIAYQTNNKTDEFTARIKPFFSEWKSLFGLSDEAAASLIHGDSVHVLIDLSGHTLNNRLPVFAWKPAPVQVSWLGYFATTGVAEIDYLIADATTLPAAEERYFTEKIWRLPETRLCFSPPDARVEVLALPALANGHVTFGCFNNLAKMNDEVVALWSRVLEAVPGSRLFLKSKQLANDSIRQITQGRFAACGIAGERLILEGAESRAKYLQAYHRVDIALDPFPYPGGTTTVESLWMGVPVLSLAGQSFLFRQGSGFLMNAGLPEWVATSTDEYVARAALHASDLQRLAKIRNELRSRVLASPLFDATRFARNFEEAIWGMWKNTAGQNIGSTMPRPTLKAEPTLMTIDLGKQKDKPMEQVLQQAVAHHNAGQFQEAMKLYQAILQDEPKHPKANHNLGAALVQMQKYAESLPYFISALDADPSHGQYWLSYIDALFKDGQLQAAQQILALARQQGLEGDDVEALAQRFKTGAELTAPARTEAQQAPSEAPPAATAKPKPGKPVPQPKKNPTSKEIDELIALYNQGRISEAANLAQALTERFPQHWVGWKMLGVVFNQMGRNADALVPMQKAAELLPNDAEAHNNLGITLQDLGRSNEAIASFRRAIKISPKFAELHSNLGTSLQSMGRLGEAEASFRQALKLQPNNAEAHNKLGNILKNSGRVEEAQASFRRALKINPDLAEALNNLGSTLKLEERTDEAESCFRRAILVKPSLAEAHSNLASILYDSGRLDEAETSYRRAIQHKPDLAEAYSNLLFCLIQNEKQDAEKLFSEHLKFARQFEAPLLATRPPCTNSREPERCLQIGFVSGDLRDHAVAYYAEPVLKYLSRYPQLSLHAYYNHVIDDGTTQRLRGYFAHWHPVAGMTDEVLAEQIRADGIDILIDLSGHTAKNRLLTFARKPAPVQASWIGYPGTTGLSGMDYFLTDRHFLPPAQFDSQFTEKIVRLPASVPFLPSKDAPPVNALPALANGYVTFGSFNRISKLSHAVITLWAQLLHALPNSRMLLGGMPEEGKYDTLVDWFAQAGIARERLSFYPRSNMESYLALHQQVDICLDTFPYNGGTTTVHALWMGVPTLTLSGSTPAGRSGASILGNVGLEAFVAQDAADFVQKGKSWATNLAALSDVRMGLRERFAKSAMAQPELIASSLEHALRVMWQRWCAGLPSESFAVDGQQMADDKGDGGMEKEQQALPIYVTQPSLPPLEEFIPYLQKIWDSKQLTNNGPFHQELEREMAKYLGVEHLSLFANATLALVTALQALRVTGEVITTPYSFVATSHALEWNGIRPVFVDIDPVSMNLDPKKIEAAITPQTTGILPVHVYGVPCAVEEIERIADTYGLKVIYDAAHTFGMRMSGGHSVLEYGDMSILSFHATKVFNTFEGGAIICRDAKTKHRIDYLKNFGFADETTVIGPGINAKMNEVQAAFGLLQLQYIDDALLKRAQVDARYREALSVVRGIRLHQIPEGIRYNYPYFPVYIEDDFAISRDELYQRLRDNGIYARRYFYPLISEFPVYRGLPSAVPGNLPVALDVSHRVLCLPIYSDLDTKTQDRIIKCVLSAAQGK